MRGEVARGPLLEHVVWRESKLRMAEPLRLFPQGAVEPCRKTSVGGREALLTSG
jgi:hypothetical protein